MAGGGMGMSNGTAGETCFHACDFADLEAQTDAAVTLAVSPL